MTHRDRIAIAPDGTRYIERDFMEDDIPDAPEDEEREDCVKEEESL